MQALTFLFAAYRCGSLSLPACPACFRISRRGKEAGGQGTAAAALQQDSFSILHHFRQDGALASGATAACPWRSFQRFAGSMSISRRPRSVPW